MREPSIHGGLSYDRRVTINSMKAGGDNSGDMEVFRLLKSKLIDMEKAEIEVKNLQT